MTVRILMVCLGNICRSPLAEGILASKLPKDKFFVDSCGTGKWHVGKQPDDRSIAVAKKNGLDISNQKCRQFHISDFETFEYIYVMDASNYSDVMEMAQNQTQKDKVDFILNELFINENVDVPDPFYGLPNGFDNVYEMLDEVCTLLANKLIAKHL
jgi:protein-tyrosine phosphatase